MRSTVLIAALLCAVACKPAPTATVDAPAPVWPDYSDVTVPVNIAPMDISSTDGSSMDVRLCDGSGKTLLRSTGRSTHFPIRGWHRALKANAGGSVTFYVRVKKDKEWTQYRPFSVNVSADKIDYGITYRRIQPGYQVYGKMSIVERSLSCFRERTLMDNRMLEANCINCHTPERTDPDNYSYHVRGAHSATMLHHDGITECLNTKTDQTGGFFVYPSWYPGGKYIAYSINQTRQQFYSHQDKRIEVYDEASDIIVYEPATHTVIRPEILNSMESFETFPQFSADGRTLYFCTAPAVQMPEERNSLKYSLCKIDFNDGTFGEKVDTLINAATTGLSISFPRTSFDGRYIMVTAADFGTFPIWHKEADLWIYDLQNGEFSKIESACSEDTESFHNWSSNSRWYVFSSRRLDGLYTVLYIGHVREDGTFCKPFLLPQRNPLDFYNRQMLSYNIPDFTSRKVNLKPRQSAKIIRGKQRTGVKVKE